MNAARIEADLETIANRQAVIAGTLPDLRNRRGHALLDGKAVSNIDREIAGLEAEARDLSDRREALETRLQEARQAERAAEVEKINATIDQRKSEALQAAQRFEQLLDEAQEVIAAYRAAAAEARALSGVAGDDGHAFHAVSWQHRASARLQHRLSGYLPDLKRSGAPPPSMVDWVQQNTSIYKVGD